MRALLHGSDERLEAALSEVGLELVREGPARALLTVAPPPLICPLAELGTEQWAARFRVCAAEPFWAFQAWLRDVLQRPAAGRWIAITSTLATQPFPGGGADGTAAVALHTLVRIAAVEYGSRGIRANAIAAGWREHSLPAGLDRELALTDTPTGRLVSEAELAAVVAWLLSDDAVQVTGEVLRLDGGYSITAGSRRDPSRLAS